MLVSTRILVAGAIALAAGGSAFTAAGLGTSGEAANAGQFVGGQVSQTVDGAVLDSIVYSFTDGSHTGINGVTLTFDAGALGKTPTIQFTGGNTVTADGSAVVRSGSPGSYIYTSTVDLTVEPAVPEVGATGISISVPSTS